jgi:hypothetical protein
MSASNPDIPPIDVRIVEDATADPTATLERAKITTTFRTFSFSVGNPGPFNILPLAPNRVRAQIVCHGVFGTGPGATSYGWIGGSSAEVQRATATGSYEGCGYITPGNTQNVPLTITGQNELWAFLDPGAAAGMTITVISEVESRH